MCSLADALGRDLEDGRDFIDREAFDLAQHEGRVIQLVDLTQGVADAFAQIARVERHSRQRGAIRIRPGQTAVAVEAGQESLERRGPVRLGGAAPGEHPAHREPQQRRLERGAGECRSGPAGRLDEDLLRHFARLGRGGQQVRADPVDDVPVSGRQRAEGQTVAAPHPLHQPLVRFLFAAVDPHHNRLSGIALTDSRGVPKGWKPVGSSAAGPFQRG